MRTRSQGPGKKDPMRQPIGRLLAGFSCSSIVFASLALLALTACGRGIHAASLHSDSTLSQSIPSLGTAKTFAVLGGQTVTNTGASTLAGDLGVSPGSAITGFPPGIVTGATHTRDAVALQAQNDVTAAYIDLAGRKCDTDLTGLDLGGRTLKHGVYCLSSDAQLTGRLILDAENDPNALFIFQIGSKLTTASNSSVVMVRGGAECRVFWQVGSSATLGTDSVFTGNILALTSISLMTRASLAGRALARNGAVTLDSNRISAANCGASCSADTNSDPLNCGACGNACEAGDTCAGGTCGSCCTNGNTVCPGVAGGDDSCVNFKWDPNNCGACGNRCTATETCTGSSCKTCPAGMQCNGFCPDMNWDPFNCGACGKQCGPSESCVNGACGTCSGSVCSGVCTELRTDPKNCGACGTVCASGECCVSGSCSTSTTVPGSTTSASCRQ